MKIGVSKPRGLSVTEFFRNRELASRWGISEWELLELLDLPSRARTAVEKLSRSAAHEVVLGLPFCYLNRDPDSTPERVEQIREAIECFPTRALLLRMHARDWENSLLAHQTLRLLSRSLKTELWADFGRSTLLDEGNSHLKIVTDPFWHPDKKTDHAPLYKIHGWHLARWIRLYGREQLESLCRLCLRTRPEIVLFAHSMRNEESLEFNELFRQFVERGPLELHPRLPAEEPQNPIAATKPKRVSNRRFEDQ